MNEEKPKNQSDIFDEGGDGRTMVLKKPMRFGCIVEGSVPFGTTYHRRYMQMIDEAVYAEEMGFDFWGTSEQHFLVNFGVGATEVLYAAVSQNTSRIKLRHMVRLLLKFNHPLRIAEQAATLDLVSNGRVELGTGRANTPVQLAGFDVDRNETRAQWEESLELIVKAFVQETVSHQGRFWNVPVPVHLTPKPLQYPHPPLLVAATSVDTLRRAGERGIGAMTMDHFLGWDLVERHAKLYREYIANPADPVSPVVNNSLGFLVLPAYIGETDKEARAYGEQEALAFAKLLVDLYPSMAAGAKDYAYFADVLKYRDHLDDLDFFLETTPGLMVGSPEFFIRQIRRLQDLGYDEVILRIDGSTMSHEQLMRAIKLIGEAVIPEFNNPTNIVRYGLMEGGVP